MKSGMAGTRFQQARGLARGIKAFELVQPEGMELEARLREGLRQVRAIAGAGGVCTIVEVAPWSRLPEQRGLLVPRDG